METRIETDIAVAQNIVVLPQKVYDEKGLGTIGLHQNDLGKLVAIGDALRKATNHVYVFCSRGAEETLLQHCSLSAEDLRKQGRITIMTDFARPEGIKSKDWVSFLQKQDEGSWIFLSPRHASSVKLPVKEPGVYPICCSSVFKENAISGRRRMTGRVTFLPLISTDEYASLATQMTDAEYLRSLGVKIETKINEKQKQTYVSAIDIDSIYGGWTIVDYSMLAGIVVSLLCVAWLLYTFL